jgi:ABC-type phosphonate transport system ATPase subunit
MSTIKALETLVEHDADDECDDECARTIAREALAAARISDQQWVKSVEYHKGRWKTAETALGGAYHALRLAREALAEAKQIYEYDYTGGYELYDRAIAAIDAVLPPEET